MKTKLTLLLALIIICSSCSSLIHYDRVPWTKTDKALAGVSILAATADVYTTHHFLKNPNNYELNPIIGKHPTDLELIGSTILSQALFFYLADRFPKLRKWFLGVKTLANGGAAIHNSTLER